MYIRFETLKLKNIGTYGNAITTFSFEKGLNSIVGQHNTSADDGYLGSGIALKLSIKKYSKKHFQRETLEHVNEFNINDREIFWIAQTSAMNRDIGYNITSGGTGGDTLTNHPNIKFIKEKLSKINSGKNNPNYGKKASVELRKKMSDAHWQKGEKHPMWGKRGKLSPKYGTKATDESKRKQSIAQSKNPITIKGVFYLNTVIASKDTHILRETIRYRLTSPNFPGYQYV